MATVILDFDSTMISCESLEVILQGKIAHNPEIRGQIKMITEQGLRGQIPFAESLTRRLEIAAPSKEEVEAFGEKAKNYLTDGLEALIKELRAGGVEVWVISGAILESVLPLCTRLSFPKSRVHAVKLLWEGGSCLGVDTTSPFCRSKVEGARELSDQWSSPIVAVGDAMSDYRLYQEGLVEHFIAYTEHFRCQEVLKEGVPEARNVQELKKRLETIIYG